MTGQRDIKIQRRDNRREHSMPGGWGRQGWSNYQIDVNENSNITVGKVSPEHDFGESDRFGNSSLLLYIGMG